MSFTPSRCPAFARSMSVLGVLILLAGTAHAAPPGVRHVRADAAPGGDGLTWATAYNDLREALITAGAAGGVITELWVKEGTYLPGPAGSTDRTRNFTLVPDVGVYGGFAGTETERDQRDPAEHPTLLDGLLGGTVKVYNVVIGAGNANTVLDGFIIGNGAAVQVREVHDTHWAGGGIHVTGSPTIRNCIIANNNNGAFPGGPVGFKPGGGVYCAPGSAATFTDCTITTNRGVTILYSGISAYGGGLAAEDCAVTLTRCVVSDNTSGGSGYGLCGGGVPTQSLPGHGGGLYARNSAVLLDSCLFVGNKTGRGGGGTPDCGSGSGAWPALDSGNGGALCIEDSAVVVLNCLLVRNGTGDGGAGLSATGRRSAGGDAGDGAAAFIPSGAVEFVNCTIADNFPGAGGPGGTSSSGTSSPGEAGTVPGVLATGTVLIDNSIVWNTGIQEISGAAVSYSDVRGGYTGTGNIDADPLFFGAASGDYRLSDSSPCIDAANSLVDTDPFAPGTQPLPSTDLDGQPRRIDIAAVADTGIGAPVVDMGAYEAQAACAIDYTGDGLVDFSDYLEFLNLYDSADGRADLNGDGLVDFSDYLEFLNLYDGDC